MNDTYAVVNKPRQPHPPAADPAHSAVATPTSRTLPASHHYDNDSSGASAAPIYSTVRPRAKPNSLPPSTTPHYDMPSPTNHRPGEGPPSLGNSREYHLSPADDDYEDFSSVSDISGLGSPGGIGFNCRIQKPRGPRDPPAEWSRLER